MLISGLFPIVFLHRRVKTPGERGYSHYRRGRYDFGAFHKVPIYVAHPSGYVISHSFKSSPDAYQYISDTNQSLSTSIAMHHCGLYVALVEQAYNDVGSLTVCSALIASHTE